VLPLLLLQSPVSRGLLPEAARQNSVWKSYASGFLQPVYPSGDIGCTVDHSFGDSTTRMAFGIHTFQDAKDIVLLKRNAEAGV